MIHSSYIQPYSDMKHYSYIYYIQPYSNMTLTSRIIPAIYNVIPYSDMKHWSTNQTKQYIMIFRHETMAQQPKETFLLNTIVCRHEILPVVRQPVENSAIYNHFKTCPLTSIIIPLQPYSDMKH